MDLFVCVNYPYNKDIHKNYPRYEHAFFPSMDVVSASAKLTWGNETELSNIKVGMWSVVNNGDNKATVINLSSVMHDEPEIL